MVRLSPVSIKHQHKFCSKDISHIQRRWWPKVALSTEQQPSSCIPTCHKYLEVSLSLLLLCSELRQRVLQGLGLGRVELPLLLQCAGTCFIFFHSAKQHMERDSTTIPFLWYWTVFAYPFEGCLSDLSAIDMQCSNLTCLKTTNFHFASHLFSARSFSSSSWCIFSSIWFRLLCRPGCLLGLTWGSSGFSLSSNISRVRCFSRESSWGDGVTQIYSYTMVTGIGTRFHFVSGIPKQGPSPSLFYLWQTPEYSPITSDLALPIVKMLKVADFISWLGSWTFKNVV